MVSEENGILVWSSSGYSVHSTMQPKLFVNQGVHSNFPSDVFLRVGEMWGGDGLLCRLV